MSTPHPITPNTATKRQIGRLLRSFARTGVSLGGDSLPPVGPESRDAVISSRLRLQQMLEDDPRLRDLNALGEAEIESLRLELARLCTEGRLQQQLEQAGIPYPIYNFFAGFAENSRGPWSRVPVVPEIPGPIAWELMGIPVKFPIGVPASGLTQNREWIDYFARRGFNILTYKTVRSSKHEPHHYPHWVFVEDLQPWQNVKDIGPVTGDLTTWPKTMTRFSTANSFGVPSPTPTDWQDDVKRALKRLGDGQLLILSIMGSADNDDPDPRAATIADFAADAKLAEATEVKAIEVNLSCPNTVRYDEDTGMCPVISSDPEMVRDVVLAVKAALKNPQTKLLAKLSYESPEVLEEIVGYIGPVVDGISGINTVQIDIHRSGGEDGSPFVGTADDPDRVRDKAGVSGSAILELGLDFVRQIKQLREAGGYSFSIIGMGGVMSVGDVDAYLEAGADAVQSATGACLNPEMPLEIMGNSRYARTRVPSIQAVRDDAIADAEPSFIDKVIDVVASGGFSLLSNRNGGNG